MERTILLVDDEEHVGAALARLLRSDGYNILRANSGPQGLAVLAQHQVGVIITDQRMPGMSGTEFLTKVRALYPDTVRIVLSGYTELNSVTDAINRGAVYKFLTKPWENDLLRANVEEAFQHYEMKMENARLSEELSLANDALTSINLELEQRVERKTLEVVHNLEVLRVSQEMLEVMPLAAIGIDRDGMIVVANRMAQQIFSADGAGYSLLGETAGTVLPADLLAWLWSGLHQRDEDAKVFSVAGRDVRCWCRLLGEFSRSRGILLVMDTQPCSERLAGSHACDL
ncbi:MAG: response regulator [Gallionellales bacterium CG03_land_8_20_14_0_80_55_15]|nr:MAG: response regulator [Gallionellales bacterium CG03_land_8_20_14_0_80_55_15]HCJ51633.1 response regulator [Gallionella sp.]